jgi:competence protein ComEC
MGWGIRPAVAAGSGRHTTLLRGGLPMGLLASVLLAVLTACWAAPTPGDHPREDTRVQTKALGPHLQIHILDVGQGDAALLRFPPGRDVLIDAGRGAGVAELLTELGVDTLELVIASHNHADHIGGMEAVLRQFPARYFMDNGVPHTTLTYRRMLETLRELKIPLLEPERRTIQVGEGRMEILPPPGEETLGHNDNSVGVMVEYGDFRASFAGDAEEYLWLHWLETFPEALAPVHLHKASHHGSRNGDILEALQRLQPELVVISAGRDNQYGHPHPEALDRYVWAGAAVKVTTQSGTIHIRAFSDGTMKEVGTRPR